MLKLLDKQSILAADDIQTEDLLIPEWNGTVRLKTLPAVEYEAFQTKVQDRMKKNGKLDLRNVTAILLCKVIIDEKGELVFTEADVAALSLKSSKAINRIWKKAQEMNGIGTEDIEELVGNSSGTPDSGGGTE